MNTPTMTTDAALNLLNNYAAYGCDLPNDHMKVDAALDALRQRLLAADDMYLILKTLQDAWEHPNGNPMAVMISATRLIPGLLEEYGPVEVKDKSE